MESLDAVEGVCKQIGIRICCRTCNNLIVECAWNDITFAKLFAADHTNHEIWLIEPNSVDNFQTRLCEFIDDISRRF